MKTFYKFLVLLLLIIFFGCSSEENSESTMLEPTFNSELLANLRMPFIISNNKIDNAAMDRSTRTAGVLNDPDVFGGSPQGDGSAYIVRSSNGISVQVQSTGLTPGNAYTAWLIIFDTDGSFIVLHLAGNIVGGSGSSSFAGSLSTGDIGIANGTDILFNEGDGSFDDPLGSMVLIHVVDHGPAGIDGPGTIPENIHEITGEDGLHQEWMFLP